MHMFFGPIHNLNSEGLDNSDLGTLVDLLIVLAFDSMTMPPSPEGFLTSESQRKCKVVSLSPRAFHAFLNPH